jgi:hypothetical protein
MAQAINAQRDLHRMVAARVTGKSEQDVTKVERAMAKPINFGKPGGMSNATLKLYAKASYGIDLTDREVEALTDAWFGLFPEMRDFLDDGGCLALDVATALGLTPASHHAHTGDDRFLRHRDNAGREHQPNAILGGMCMKVLRSDLPTSREGRPYYPGDIDYFWTQVAALIDSLPSKLQKAVRERRPSQRLQRAVVAIVEGGRVFTATGRLRAHAAYCARHNTVFQGLAADGAKLAMWLLWREGYRIVNFVHDEFLIEVPQDSDLKAAAEEIRRLMIQGMREVVPDVRIDVSYAATNRWHKDAEAVYDAAGERLLLWRPAGAETA